MSHRLAGFVLAAVVCTSIPACGMDGLGRPDTMPKGVRSNSLAASGPSLQQIASISSRIDAALTHAQTGELVRARQTYLEMEEDWEEIEGSVRKASGPAYEKIWDAMSDVRTALVKTKTPDQVKVVDTLRVLRNTFSEQQKRIGTT